jgi:maleylpyruvate isomerase
VSEATELPASQLQQRLAWLKAGNELFAGALAELPDDGFAEPCLLPGWSRAKLLGHVARNADALCNLLHWAATGIETPMYPSPDAREQGIVASATQSPQQLRDDVATTTARLDRSIAELPEAAWQAPVRTAQGRSVPGAEVPWMRVRELFVHAVDLDGPVSFDDVPVELAAELLADAFRFAVRKPACPQVRVLASDAEFDQLLGDNDRCPVVRAPVRQLLPWALGRPRLAPAEAGTWPVLPAWL